MKITGWKNDLRMPPIAALLQRTDLPHEVERRMLPASQVLDQAHHEAVFFRRLNNDGADLCFAEGNEGLEPSLAADQVVAVLTRTLRDRDRLLEAELLDAGHQFLEDAPVAGPGVQNRDLLDRNEANFGGGRSRCRGRSHAALPSAVRAAR
jgi:hypothetical protein